MRDLPRIALVFAAFWLAGGAASGASRPPRVVASIMPVHSLAAGVMEGVGAPTLLVKGAATPHTFALRPSGARALRRAEVVFWVGAQLEIFLVKPLAALARNARVVRLSGAEGLTLYPARAGGGAAPGGGAGPTGTDTHIWLSPANARAMARAMARALGATDPANAGKYRENRMRLEGRLAGLDQELKARLGPVRAAPYIVLHDAFQYFEKHYGLRFAGAIAAAPGRRPGARRLYAIRKRIVDVGARCVFGEPQFQADLVAAAAGGTPARTAVLDPLGAALPPGGDAYFALMRALAESFRGCLLPPGR